eukprot:gene4506-6730_t
MTRWQSIATILKVVTAMFSILICAQPVCLYARMQNAAAHRNNWGVVVSTSMYWYNYRHTTNALVFYHTLKRLGVPDSNILLLLAEDHACNPHNAEQAALYTTPSLSHSVYDDEVEVDYRGPEVTAEIFVKLMTGRLADDIPHNKRLNSGPDSNVFVYMTGHGGVDFLKFRDTNVISGTELGNMFYTMYEQKRYKQVFFMLDTCHAESMLAQIHSPNILSIGSSAWDEDSYAVTSSRKLGVMLVDDFTGNAMKFLSQITAMSKATVADLFTFIRNSRLRSHPVMLTSKFPRKPRQVLLTEFLASTPSIFPLSPAILSTLPIASIEDAGTKQSTTVDKQTPVLLACPPRLRPQRHIMMCATACTQPPQCSVDMEVERAAMGGEDSGRL